MPAGPFSGVLRAATVAWLSVGLLCAPSRADERPSEPDDYRMEEFRAPVPATLRGARVVDTDAAHALWEHDGAVFIDVMPYRARPPGLPEDVIWRAQKRDNIPGSAWLPNVGYGALHPTVEQYFRDNLESLTKGDLNRPVLFYCLADCWMSWNAAKRALSYGYTEVIWFPDGTDEWSDAGHALERSSPVPVPPS